MYEKVGYKEVKSFAHRGVTILAPKDHQDDIDTREGDLLWEPGMRTVEPDFKPHRLVIDIGINNPGAQESTQTVPKLILRVYFSHDDLKNILNIKLAYWKFDRWNVFTDVLLEKISGNQIWAGYFDVEIDDWIDPPIALGS